MPHRLPPDHSVEARHFLAAGSQTITANDQTIQHNDRPVMVIGATQWGTFTGIGIADGSVDGQHLVIIASTDVATYTIDSSKVNLHLSGDLYVGWISAAEEHVLALVWDDADSVWRELLRCGIDAAQNDGNWAGNAGGYDNTNSGNASGSVGGQGNENTARCGSSVGGYKGKTRHEAESLAAARYRHSAGDCQVTNFMMRDSFLADGSADELTSPEQWTLEEGTAVAFTVTIVATYDDESKQAMFKRMAMLERPTGGGNTTQIGATQTIGTDIDPDGGFDVSVGVDGTGHHLSIEVTGPNDSKLCRWTAHVQAQVVG